MKPSLPKNQMRSLSKHVSLVLRHKPEAAGLVLDDGGWVEISVLITGLESNGRVTTVDEIEQMVQTSDKQRFETANGRIRCVQGHSVAVDLELERLKPPEVLFHGTVQKFVSSIRKQGLRAQSRNHVHLSESSQTAAAVGSRRGEPVILVVNARSMHERGHAFFQASNGVWLTSTVPANFLVIPGSEDQ